MAYDPYDPITDTYEITDQTSGAVGVASFNFGGGSVSVLPYKITSDFSFKGSAPPAGDFDFLGAAGLSVALESTRPSLSASALVFDPFSPADPVSAGLNFGVELKDRDPLSVPLNFSISGVAVFPALATISIGSPRPSLKITVNVKALSETLTLRITSKAPALDIDEEYLGYVTRKASVKLKSNRPSLQLAATYDGIPPRQITASISSRAPVMKVRGIYDNRVHRFVVQDLLRLPWSEAGAFKAQAGSDWEQPVPFITETFIPWGEGVPSSVELHTLHQVMLHAPKGVSSGWVEALPVPFEGGDWWQVAIPISSELESLWDLGKPLTRESGSSFSSALPVSTRSSVPWGDSLPLGLSLSNPFQDGLHRFLSEFVPWGNGVLIPAAYGEFEPIIRPADPEAPLNPVGAPNPLNFQCSLELGDKRYVTVVNRVYSSRYDPPPQSAVSFNFSGETLGDDVYDFSSPFVEELVSIEVAESYIDPLNVPLRFSDNPCGLSDKERGVPLRSVYIVLNEMRMIRADTGQEIEVFTANLRIDKASWCWSLSAGVSRDDLSLVEPSEAGPVEVEFTLNGFLWKFVVESYSEDRQFGSQTVTINGRSRSAYLDAPYVNPLSGVVTADLYARQIVEDQVTKYGFSVDWKINDGNPDAYPNGWLVKANSFSFQSLSPMAIINKVVEAVGGYINTDPSSDILHVLPGYPTASWHWNDVGASFDLSLKKSIVTRQSLKWTSSQTFDAIWVSAEVYGQCNYVFKSWVSPAAAVVKDTVTHPLLGDAFACRERGKVELSSGGLSASMTLDLPLSKGLAGLVLPGAFLEVDPVGIPGDELWRGLVRSTAIVATRSPAFSVVQTLELERHYGGRP